MTDSMRALDTWAASMLVKLQPPARRRLARELAIELRRTQQRRIASQQNPDGSPYTPRKQPTLRSRKGRIKQRKGAMFRKLRQAKHLRTRASAQEASIGFAGRVARIARVHQYGQRDRVSPGGPQVRYAQRELLGLTPALHTRIRALLVDHLTRG